MLQSGRHDLVGCIYYCFIPNVFSCSSPPLYPGHYTNPFLIKKIINYRRLCGLYTTVNMSLFVYTRHGETDDHAISVMGTDLSNKTRLPGRQSESTFAPVSRQHRPSSDGDVFAGMGGDRFIALDKVEKNRYLAYAVLLLLHL